MKSLLDTDLYKLTMQQAVWKQFRGTQVTYTFIERNQVADWSRFPEEKLRESIEEMKSLCLQKEERRFLESTQLFDAAYLDWLESYSFDSHEVDFQKDDKGLQLTVNGPWERTILWEVPLLSTICEIYYSHVETDWNHDYQNYYQKTREKARELIDAGCAFTDFGTRRRRSYQIHYAAVQALADVAFEQTGPGKMLGTSNVHLAQQFGLSPIGTIAHEWFMVHGTLYGIEEANRYALENWLKQYPERGTIALTDTYTLDLFLDNFDSFLAEQFEGVRQDSGDPISFIDKLIAHYINLKIDPANKKFVFSDGLNCERAIQIHNYIEGRGKDSYGIGTFITNDFPDSPPMDIVIKLTETNGQPSIKIGEGDSKECGDSQAIHNARKTISHKLSKKEDS